ncbi:tetratricopeptide repeat protein [Planctomicrobium sp. SH661]|uniref:tetratricopeptide repeat protein n=1 Tax=Planctomicrobium sp. SH661 TaxID=3448124 RepID=UPI003F5BC4D5
MPAGSVPKTSMNFLTASRSESLPMVWRLYRFGLATAGLAWICIASTLCGCSSANGWAKNQSGKGYYNRGNYAAARSEFERALLDSPYNATYAYNVGKAMEKEGDIAGAEQMFQHAMTLDPTHQPSYRGMSDLLVAQGRQDEAAALLTAWSQTQPYSSASHVEMAALQRKSGNYAAAEQEINTALQIRPRSRQALNERSRLYQATGRPNRGGGPFSELALTSRTPQQAMQPRADMVSATPQTSGALHMAATMPQKDPTLLGGVIQASYSNPQSTSMQAGVPQMMTASPPQMHQANMFPAGAAPGMSAQGPWMPAPGVQPQPAVPMMTQGNVPQMMPGQMQFAQPQMTQYPVPQPTMGPVQLMQPQMAPGSMPTGPAAQIPHQPVELGEPVPVTQAAPGFPVTPTSWSTSPEATNAPLFDQQEMVGAAPVVQAF